MKKMVLAFVVMNSLVVFAGGATPKASLSPERYMTLRYRAVKCVYSISNKEQQTVNQDLMTITVEADLGRFAQIQFGDKDLKIQYQILLENHPEKPGTINVLQNLAVGELESSSEFAAPEPDYARLAQGIHSVRCELLKNPKID